MKNIASNSPLNSIAYLFLTCILFQLVGCSVDETQTIADLKAMQVIVSKDADGKVSALNNLPVDTEGLTKALDLICKLQAPKTITILDASGVTPEHIVKFASLSEMIHLEMHGAPIGDADIKPLVGHGNLKGLILIDSKGITSAAMPDIAKIPNLGLLTLTGTSVDSGYEHLHPLKKFEWIVVGGLTIDEDDAKKISEIPTITHVTMDGTDISDAALAILKSNRECTVDGTTKNGA